MTEKKIFNQDSKERFEEAKMINGNPNGIFNFNKTPHSVARSIYKKMCNRTWFPEQVNISKDKINYSTLTPKEKKAYDLVLAQLITNDSIQVNQLMDKINSYITSPIVNAALARQAAEECYIEGTEVLTAEGFKGFENLKETDLVANYNEDGTITFTKPKLAVAIPQTIYPTEINIFLLFNLSVKVPINKVVIVAVIALKAVVIAIIKE